LFLIATFASTVIFTQVPADAALCANDHTGLIALPDLAGGSYMGRLGGLYPDGSNTPPADYAAVGEQLGNSMTPRDPDGTPDPANGRIGFLGAGPSLVRMEFQPFIDRVAGAVDPKVTMVNGGIGGHDLRPWADPTSDVWPTTDATLADAGLTPAQVDVVWFKNTFNKTQGATFDAWVQSNDASMRRVRQNLAAHFPNLTQVFLSSRTYGGYIDPALGHTNEPWAYEHGFAVKDLIADSVADPTARPWLGWGPYLWTDGAAGRSDGYTWLCSDVDDEGMHPNDQGAQKIAALLDDDFRNSPFTAWFTAGLLPAPPAVSTIVPDTLTAGATHQPMVVKGSDFQDGLQVDLGPGVTVEAVHVTSAKRATATVTATPDAAPGHRAVVVTNPDGVTGEKVRGFTVLPAPTVTGADPVALRVGATGQQVTIAGGSFEAGLSLDFGAGITVDSVSVDDPATITAVLTVAADATVGTRDITVSNPDGSCGSRPAGFRVRA
jgi:hypothetical protein